MSGPLTQKFGDPALGNALWSLRVNSQHTLSFRSAITFLQ